MELAEQPKEWQGQQSKKFTSNRKHVEPIQSKEVPHPIYTMFGKRHFEKKETPTYEWRPSLKVVGPVDHSNDK